MVIRKGGDARSQTPHETPQFLSVYHEHPSLATGTALFLRRTDAPRETAYQLLTLGAKRLWGLDPLPEIARTPLGAPYFPHHPRLRFSISHSRRYALCALSGGPVGCDVEELRPRLPGLPQRCFSSEELARWQAMGGGWEGFYPLWTEKEAAAKYLGTGLRADLKSLAPPKDAKVYHFRVDDAFVCLCCGQELVYSDGL